MDNRAKSVLAHSCVAAVTAVSLLPGHALGVVGERLGVGMYCGLGAAAWVIPAWQTAEAHAAITCRHVPASARAGWAGWGLLALVSSGLCSCGGRFGDALALALTNAIGLAAYLLVIVCACIAVFRRLGVERTTLVHECVAEIAQDVRRQWLLAQQQTGTLRALPASTVQPARLPAVAEPEELRATVVARPMLTEGSFTLPNVGTLTVAPKPAPVGKTKAEQSNAGQALHQLFFAHNVVATHVDSVRGALVDLLVFAPAASQKLSAIKKLTDELEMMHEDMRLICPMPGTGRFGIEVPLKSHQRRTIELREILESSAWTKTTAKLPLALGLTATGEPVVVDLTACPHLLVAGATGAGKSVGLNTMLVSLLLHNKPTDLQLILIDPKVVELARYRSVPHLIFPPATETETAIDALTWACDEMDRRYEHFATIGATNIDTANARGGKHFARIVIVIDEYADLSAVDKKTKKADGELGIEGLVTRIAQKARACGMHVILATQRPSTDVVTGLIKANFPARIAYKVAQKEDSRTIIGSSGAQQLLGKGDSLCLISELDTEPVRVHGAYVHDEDIMSVVRSWSVQSVQPPPLRVQPTPEPTFEHAEQNEPEDSEIIEVQGDRRVVRLSNYELALDYAQRNGAVSIRQLQKRLQVGFNKAQEVMEQMRDAGVIEPGGEKNTYIYVGP